MTRYRYTGSSWYRRDEVVEPGDVVEDPTDAEKAAFDDSLDAIEDDGGESEGSVVSDTSESDPDIADAPINPSELTVDELADELESGDFSAAELDAIKAAEEARSEGSRATAMDAIEAERDDTHA